MKDSTFAWGILAITLILAVFANAILIGCSTPPKYNVCDECSACEDVEALIGAHDFFLETEDN